MRLVTLNDLRCHHEIVILWFWVKCFNSYWNKYHEICKRASKVYSEHSVNTALPILDWILHKHIKSISILGWNSFMFLSINKVFCFQPCSILNCWSCSYQSYFAASNSYILSLLPMLTSAPLLSPHVVRRTSTERRTSSDHIKGIVFPSDDPGDRGRGGGPLPVAIQKAPKTPNPVKARSNRWTRHSSGKWISTVTEALLLFFFADSHFLWSKFHFTISVQLDMLVSRGSFTFCLTCIQFPSVFSFSSTAAIFLLKAHTSFPLNPLHIHLMCLLTLLTYSIPSQRCHDVALHLFALQDETVVRQRRQISDYEHLENVHVINTNQIPLTAIGRSSGLWRQRWTGEKWR